MVNASVVVYVACLAAQLVAMQAAELGRVRSPKQGKGGSRLSKGKSGKSGKSGIKVMTQNQYVGFDALLIPAANNSEELNAVMLATLQTVTATKFTERVRSLSRAILDTEPDIVGLQEVSRFECTEVLAGGSTCAALAEALSDHLDLTLAELGDDYYEAATVEYQTGFVVPVITDPNSWTPNILLELIDRDVILVRKRITATPVDFACGERTLQDGCQFEHVVQFPTPAGTFPNPRGFAAVDFTLDGTDYRVYNTHLEVFSFGNGSAQQMQAAELVETIVTFKQQGQTTIVVGDMNSAPGEVCDAAYNLLTNGGLIDAWDLRRGNDPGFTAFQDTDLMNDESALYSRIDFIFTDVLPDKVDAEVLFDRENEKTPSGLWPSNHGTVFAQLEFN